LVGIGAWAGSLIGAIHVLHAQPTRQNVSARIGPLDVAALHIQQDHEEQILHLQFRIASLGIGTLPAALGGSIGYLRSNRETAADGPS